jgi:hypothetical protein
MSDDVSNLSPNQTDELLDELFTEVQRWEGSLAGGVQLDKGALAVQSLRETRVSFGNPRDRLIPVTADRFVQLGIELDPIYQEQMAHTFDFYYMTLTLDLRPKPGALFKRLSCELDFDPEDTTGTIVQTIFPKSEWRSVLNWGGSMNLGLNGNLEWEMGVDANKIAEAANLPAGLQAQVSNKNNMSSFITMPDYAFEVGRFDILAQGEGNKVCFWHIEEPDLQKMPTVQFGIVFKVPQGTEKVTLRGIAQADPDMNWLVANVRNVFENLSSGLQSLLRRRQDAASQLARIAAEQWLLPLPRAGR